MWLANPWALYMMIRKRLNAGVFMESENKLPWKTSSQTSAGFGASSFFSVGHGGNSLCLDLPPAWGMAYLALCIAELHQQTSSQYSLAVKAPIMCWRSCRASVEWRALRWYPVNERTGKTNGTSVTGPQQGKWSAKEIDGVPEVMNIFVRLAMRTGGQSDVPEPRWHTCSAWHQGFQWQDGLVSVEKINGRKSSCVLAWWNNCTRRWRRAIRCLRLGDRLTYMLSMRLSFSVTLGGAGMQ